MASFLGEKSLSLVLNWLLRALIVMGGVSLAVAAWPVAWGAWEAQKADAVVSDLRFGRPRFAPLHHDDLAHRLALGRARFLDEPERVRVVFELHVQV